MKKIVNITLVLFMIFAFVGCGKKEENNKNNNNSGSNNISNNEKVISEKQVESFSITNTSLTYNDGISTLKSTVTNTSSEPKYIKSFDIYVKDKDGNEIAKLTGYIDATIAPGSSRTIESNITTNLENANDVEYEIKY